LWTYELEFSARKRDRAPEVTREVVRQGVEGKIVLNRPDLGDERDSERLTQTALEQVAANKSFREVADFLGSMRYLHVVPQIVRDPQRSIGRDDPFGGDLIERINTAPEKTRKARLKRMEEALRIAVPQMRSLELEIDKKGVPHLRANYAHWRPQGAWQREDRFSDGTLRLLGLVWSLQERGGPLLLEEPELSLNSAVVSQLAPLFARATRNSKRQVLVTTHSAELLSNNVRADEAFVLNPTEEGTEIALATTLKGVVTEVAAGLPLGELLTARTRIKDIERLPLLELMTQ
jgi:predicted ATPase